MKTDNCKMVIEYTKIRHEGETPRAGPKPG